MSDSDIVTRCPQCNTAFRVTPNQLSVAGGVVRCGSCLAVFKAVDYETKSEPQNTANPSSQNNGSQINQPKSEPPVEDEVVLEFEDELEFEDPNELIEDEIEETIISSDEAIYDLETDEPGSKTSLFERKLKPVSQQSKENADESWALDMLADLKDDDDIQPLRFKRKNKDPQQQPEAAAPAIEEKPAKVKPKVVPIEEKQEKAKKEPSPPAQEKSDDILEASSPAPEEEVFIENEVFEPNNDEPETGDFKDIESLYFDEDAVTESIDLDEAAPLPADDSVGQHRDITDEEIENAMNIRTHYAGEELFIQNIEPPPVEMEWYEHENTKRWLWFVGAIFAILILVIQFFIFRFDTLSKHPTYRPFYKEACLMVGCRLPVLVDIDKIRTTNLIVRSHPNRENALIVDAILINSASFDQNFPVLRLEFSDINNTILASRNLEPHNYLRGELAGAHEMPANQPIQISLEIVDPGEAAVNYQLSVLKSAKF